MSSENNSNTVDSIEPSDMFINPDEVDGEIVVRFEDKRVDYDKHEDYRVEDR
jgi:hypothetical protein